MEAFSDGVMAIIITIMVLELKVPERGATLASLKPVLPVFLSYVLSFIYVGIYWNNHHHMLHSVKHINGKVLWCNLLLLFWLSLIPFTTAWMGEYHSEPYPMALYGFVLLMAAASYVLLQAAMIQVEGKSATLAQSVGKDFKGKLSMVMYLLGIGLAFVHTGLSILCYVSVAAMWIIPDQRIEKNLKED